MFLCKFSFWFDLFSIASDSSFFSKVLKKVVIQRGGNRRQRETFLGLPIFVILVNHTRFARVKKKKNEIKGKKRKKKKLLARSVHAPK